ncbi:Uncharacterised protein [Klebsiella pneumoniae]|uniref:hypothetical protein n=2 Tax=Klebsiella pneumoniae TaxID=573 RepID=UPI001090F172|nr:hypothetical protein [Klebsiella pneumoniae]MBD7560009.1 hypothetical protein [Klebsiella pneumoniae]VGA61815.1 Uncharacterised protein [Klebsiella pneumoniae]HDY7350154.1 hypothetical protein [Klebsiella pneumoniae]
MNIETVNELIASLESAGELSIREQKFLKLAKAFKQLAEENAALKSSRAILAENALETCNEVYTAGFRNTALHDGLMESTGNRNKYPNPIRTLVDEAKRNIETPATDRIVAGIKADGVEEFAAHLRANYNGASVCKIIALGADDFAKQLRKESQHD